MMDCVMWKKRQDPIKYFIVCLYGSLLILLSNQSVYCDVSPENPVEIIEPAGGENYLTAGPITITWQTHMPTAGDRVRLEFEYHYTYDLGEDSDPSGRHTVVADLPFVWNSPFYRIRATSVLAPQYSDQSEFFTIYGADPEPVPTPYPILTAPAVIETTHTLPVFDGRRYWVHEGDSIQAAVDQAISGDRIILAAAQFTEAVKLTTHTLLIESVPGNRVVWNGTDPEVINWNFPPDEIRTGDPALRVENGGNVVLRGLSIRGSDGISWGGSWMIPTAGGEGATVLACHESTIQLVDTMLSGGDGGEAGRSDYGLFEAGPGGNGAPAIHASGNSMIWADSLCQLQGGAAGAGEARPPAIHGDPAMPIVTLDDSHFNWTSFFGIPSQSFNTAQDWLYFE